MWVFEHDSSVKVLLNLNKTLKEKQHPFGLKVEEQQMINTELNYLLWVVVRINERPRPDPLDVHPHVPVENRHKLEQRLGGRGELQTPSSIGIRSTLKPKPPGHTHMDLEGGGGYFIVQWTQIYNWLFQPL